jgi:hypothetical protein
VTAGAAAGVGLGLAPVVAAERDGVVVGPEALADVGARGDQPLQATSQRVGDSLRLTEAR